MSHKNYDKNNNLLKNGNNYEKNNKKAEDFIENKRFFVNQIKDNIVKIDGDEFNHLVNVMRLKIGDDIILICNDDYDYHSKIIEINKKFAVARIINKVKNQCNANINITAFVAVNKREPINLMVRMLSELGISRFIPFTSKWTNAVDATEKTERYQKIADQSAKQCRRSKTLQIESIKKLSDICSQFNNYDAVFFAFEDEKNLCFNNIDINSISKNKQLNIAFIIGPVAGFDVDEAEQIINNGAISVSLGKRILKADTACIAMASLIMNKFENM